MKFWSPKSRITCKALSFDLCASFVLRDLVLKISCLLDAEIQDHKEHKGRHKGHNEISSFVNPKSALCTSWFFVDFVTCILN